ncbi:type B DNA-directed DNA polymerase [Halorhabdus amylolytica]|uniref:type B DNA-directed DNA polymerase n=1 Tax=Halorhabdus amylolytica TaxID=2559573 RepID=UPI0010AA267D|nr:type B DNA-directed DNA polymerase [Halorhabdus amylolytica]
MTITIDRRDGTPIRWVADGAGAEPIVDADYQPALYAAAREDRTRHLEWLADELAADPKVAGVTAERHYRTLAAEERSPTLRIDLDRLGEVRQVAREIRERERREHAPGTLSLYDVDLDPGFRYCLDTGCDPTPNRDLRTLSLSLPPAALAEGDLSNITLEGNRSEDEKSVRERIEADETVREVVERTLAEQDPDVLIVSSAELVSLLGKRGVDLGRRPGYRQLAGESTYVSYGQVGHSPARYAVPGRAIVDRSNSFLLDKSSMAGLEYFVERAGKPLQELARDSIGGVLTAIEIREARKRDVLAPAQKRQTERWKSLETLHSADRGGFSFQPETDNVGGERSSATPGAVHEDVHELDFASLYPNIIREHRVSPETVCCDCHDTADVPELGYSICDSVEGSFLGSVLGPLLDDRSELKRRRRACDGPTPELDAKIEAIKWVLVSCFGYQGYRHAKFGRIEVHEAINAFARECLLTAKEHVEAAGWRVVHGIVDSLWVTPDPDREQTPIREVAGAISDEIGITLEHESHFDWIAFCPRKRSSGAALMRYFGRWNDDAMEDNTDRYKLRGIEARQRSTTAFVERAQRDLLTVFDRERTPQPVCERLARQLGRLRSGAVATADLAITQRVSKHPETYNQATRGKAALERASELGVDRSPGQSVRYVIVDDDRSGPERVRLAFEGPETYDADFYADRLLRAAESVLAPLGWDREDIRQWLDGTRNTTLSSFE